MSPGPTAPAHRIRFCLPLAFNAADQWIQLARAAEDAGFDAIIVSDHLMYPGDLQTPYPYTTSGQPRWEPSTPWPDPMIAIAALGAATERIRFITSIYILPLRHPVVAAKQIASAALFARGRLTLGIGAGWMREEFDLLGQPFAARGRRMEESIEILRKLWSGGMVEHRGEFYEFGPLELSPPPPEPIPIWGGGTSEVALRRAATRLDGWLSEIQSLDELADFCDTLRRLRAESTRASLPFAITGVAQDAYRLEHFERLEAMGVTHTLTVPWLLYGMTKDDVSQKCEGIRRFGDEIISRFR